MGKILRAIAETHGASQGKGGPGWPPQHGGTANFYGAGDPHVAPLEEQPMRKGTRLADKTDPPFVGVISISDVERDPMG